jgi:integrase
VRPHTVRLERDRHYECTRTKCVAPDLRRRLAEGRNVAPCVPRRTWWVRFTDLDGRRVSEGYKDEAQARKEHDQVKARLELKIDPRSDTKTPTAPPFEKIAADALALYTATRTLRETTQENHTNVIANHFVPYFNKMPITKIDRIAVGEFIGQLRGTLKDSSVRSALPTLSIVLDYAVGKGWLTVNPLRAGAPLWRADHSGDEVVDPFTPDELRKIFKSAYQIDHTFGCLVQVMAQTGLRPGEALGLRQCDLDMEHAEVHVQGTYSRARWGKPKNRSSVRVVSLLHAIVDEATAATVIGQIKKMKVTGMDPETRMFPYEAPAFWLRWKRTLTRAGVRYRKPHALRHSWASILLSRNTPLAYVAKAGGWKSPAILLTVYTKWVQEAAEQPGGAIIRGFSSKQSVTARRI